MLHTHTMRLCDALPLGLVDCDGQVEQVRRYACPCGYWTVWTGDFPAGRAVSYAQLVLGSSRDLAAPTTAYTEVLRRNTAALRRMGRRGGVGKEKR